MAPLPKGYLALVLHAHLPFVRHPENRHHLEELWLFEAITDTYLPLLDLLEGWFRDGVSYRLSLSLTPPLASMLRDPLLQERYVEHLDRSAALARQEMRKHQGHSQLFRLASMYLDRFEGARRAFVERHQRDLIAAFRRHLDHGLEILASGATHALLPLVEPYRSSARAQILTGVNLHRELFGREPRGFWLPECGFHPDHAPMLAEAGIRFTVVDTHGLLHAIPRPRYANFAPVYTPSGVAVFGRDVETSKQVWSAHEGYPGDREYREFYRDVGYDNPWEEVAPFLPYGVRTDTGIKYYRITGKTEQKELYDPDLARAKAELHAGNFVFNRVHQVRFLASQMDRPPIVVAPYDAELFGHWWFEGPWFLDAVVRKVHETQGELELITPLDYLERHPTNQVAAVSPSTWGYKGYHEVWLEGSNDWIYRHLHEGARRMEALANRYTDPDPLLRRALNQAAAQLMLAQSSDWAFIMKTGTVVEYAVRRTKEHVKEFLKLEDEIVEGRIDEPSLVRLEERTGPFGAAVDYRYFRSEAAPRDGAASANAYSKAYSNA